MGSSFQDRFARVRSRLRRTIWVHGFGWLIGSLVLFLIVAGTLDWLVHMSVGMRMIVFAMFAGLATWISYRYLLAPLVTEVTDLDLALRVERNRPDLEERLSSTIEFLQSPYDPMFGGSIAMREKVVTSAMAHTENLDLSTVIEQRPARNRALQALGIVAVAAGLMALDPLTTSVAVRRIINPLSSLEFPHQTTLSVTAVNRMAKGDPFEVQVEVEGKIPERVELLIRFDSNEKMAPLPLRQSTDQNFNGGLDVVNESFEYAVAGGDAEVRWSHVTVEPAPELSDLQITMHYPQYTGLAPEKAPPGKGHVKAVIGTKIELTAKANRALEKAELRFEKPNASAANSNTDPNANPTTEPKNSPGLVETTPAKISEDGLQISAEFTITHDTAYSVVLEDKAGMNNAKRSPSRFLVNAVPDIPPEITLEHPTADIDATTGGALPIKALLKDDFGLGKSELVYIVEPSASVAQETKPEIQRIPLAAYGSQTRRAVLQHRWELAPLKLREGSIVVMHLECTDLRDVPGPNIGRSKPIRIRIVNRVDLVRGLETQQQQLRNEIDRLLKLEESVITQSSEVRQELKAKTSGANQADVEKLQAAEMLQTRIREKISDPDTGLSAELNRIQDQLRNNKVEDVDANKRLEMIRSEFGRLAEQHFPPVAQEMTQAIKTAKPDQKKAIDSKGTEQHLDKAINHQEQIRDSFAEMLKQMDQWETVAGATNDVREIQRKQQEIGAETEKVGQSTFGKQQSELTDDQKGALARNAERQNQLSGQLQRTQDKLDRLADKTRTENTELADVVKEAVKDSRQSNVSGKMSDASKQIADNRLTDAANAQRNVAEQLQKLVESLENQQEKQLERLVKQLKEAKEQGQQLAAEQNELMRKNAEVNQFEGAKKTQELEKLTRQQQDLQKRTEEFARKLSRQRAQDASRSAGRSASRMSDAAQAMGNDQQQEAEQKQKDAEKELEEAVAKLEKEIKKTEQQLAQEQMGKIEDALRQMYDRQIGLRDEVVRLETMKRKAGKLTRGQVQSINALARSQTGLAEESKSFREKLSAARVIAKVIDLAIDEMKLTSQLLEKRETGLETQQYAQSAALRFKQILDVLQPEQKPKKDEQEGGGGGSSPPGAGQQNSIPGAAQIKLLISLERELAARTDALVKQKKGDWTDEQKKTLDRIYSRQKSIRDLILELVNGQVQEEEPGPEGTGEKESDQ